MPDTQPRFPRDRFPFLHNVAFSRALPFIREADCAIISAERAGYTFGENTARTEALRYRYLDAFRRGKESLVFDLRLKDSKGVQPREWRRQYIFVAERPAYDGEREVNPFLKRTIEICRLFQAPSFLFIPSPERSAETAAEIVVVDARIDGSSSCAAQVRAARIVGEESRIEIHGGDAPLTFEVAGSSPIVTGSMNNAYLRRALNARRFPGAPHNKAGR